MKLVITGGRSRLGSALAGALRTEHEVTVAPDGDLRDEDFSRQIVEGQEAIVHLAPLYPDLPAEASEREILDLATRGTYVLLNAAVAAGVRRVVIGSTLAMMERYPASWRVAESWQPQPDVTDVRQLASYLAEESAKQAARVEPIAVVSLRFGEIVDDDSIAGRRYDPRWLHVDDAVQACRRALTMTPVSRGADSVSRPQHGWWIYHIPGGGAHTRFPLVAARGDNGLGYEPRHDFAGHPGASDPLPEPTLAEAAGDLSLLAPRERIPSRPIRNVVVFGAGGPLAAATTRLLTASYRLRITDIRAIADIVAENKPQSPGAPLPEVLGPPHEMAQVDVSDLDQVIRACEGMDAIVNCTVVRPHPVQAFLVNCIGAYNVMRAAVAHGIRRVVHTGPQSVSLDRPAGYGWDFDVPNDAPPRAGTWLYAHSKYLGREVVRLFAEQYDLVVPALYFSSFVNPEIAKTRSINPMTVSWDDAGHAMRRALEVPSLPRPYESFHILTDLPHGKYSTAKARALLGWQPRDNLASMWARR